jgi:hypothetical protein
MTIVNSLQDMPGHARVRGSQANSGDFPMTELTSNLRRKLNFIPMKTVELLVQNSLLSSGRQAG